MSEYYCSHKPPCCPKLASLESQLKAEKKESENWHNETRQALLQLRAADELVKEAKEVEYFDEASMLRIKEAVTAYEKVSNRG